MYFRDEYNFLSNFYPSDISICGYVFPTVENAYQCSKTKDKSLWTQFRSATPGQCKRLGRKLVLREDWEIIKEDIMYLLLKQKFGHEKLRDLLLKTGDIEIVEDNYWNDTYWGRCNGVGENRLGRLLMRVREEIG